MDRRLESHKYDYGHVLVIGGSPGMVGAPLLVAMAALRTGAGLATIASSADVIDKLEKRVVEVMTLRIDNLSTIIDFVKERKVSAVAVGSGMDANQLGLVKQLLPRLTIPAIIDAGALAAHQLAKEAILTPHTGELARLVGGPLPPDAPAFVKKLAGQWQQVVVLKGNHTSVAGPQGEWYVNHTGNPGLATAGTGDVLSGVIAGLLAQGAAPFEAAQYGVYLHGLAGDLAAQDKTQPGMVASDVIDKLPAALQSIVTNSTK